MRWRQTWKARLFALLFVGAAGGLIAQVFWAGPWAREAAREALLGGNPSEAADAAVKLAMLGDRTALLQALRAPSATVRQVARQALAHLWANAAGTEAREQLIAIREAVKGNDLARALQLANKLVNDYPDFAEGWNQRAALHCAMGEYAKAIDDCQQALTLEPWHYAAWQGLGACYLQQGRVQEAVRCLQAARHLSPHDETTLRWLRECQEMLRTLPAPQDRRTAEVWL